MNSSSTKQYFKKKDLNDEMDITESTVEDEKNESSQTFLNDKSSRTFLMINQGQGSSDEDENINIAEEKQLRDDVEQITFFANERRYTKLVSIVLLLVTIGSLILEFGTSTETTSDLTNAAVRIFFILLGAIIIAYSWVVYKRFQHIILSRKQSCNDGNNGNNGNVRRPYLFLACVILISMIIISIHTWSLLSPSVLENRSEKCFRHPLIVNSMNFEANDIFHDIKHDVLLIPSASTISAIHKSSQEIGEGKRNTLESSISGEEGKSTFKAITYGTDGRILAVREHNKNNNESSDDFIELLELEWNDSDGNDAMLTLVQSWDINNSKGTVEGITWVSDDDDDGFLLIAIDDDSGIATKKDDKSGRGEIHTYSMPLRNTRELTRLKSTLNRTAMNSGLEDSKIGSLQYFEGFLYVLHNNARVVRVWDIVSGDLKSEWELPLVHGGYNKQWEGIFLERTDIDQQRRSLQQQQSMNNYVDLVLSELNPPSEDVDKKQQQSSNNIAWQYQQNTWQNQVTTGLSEFVDLDSLPEDLKQKYLRGMDDDDVDHTDYPSKSSLMLHLALNAPAQIWSIAVSQDDKTGRIILPSCASPHRH